MMSIEIERKWICDFWPFNCKQTGEWLVDQSYLYVNEDCEVRLCKKTNTLTSEILYIFSVKLGEGLKRTEIETKISETEYEDFIRTADKPPIIKQYRTFEYLQYKLEASVIDDNWMYIEIEFNLEEDANQFVCQFSDWVEVTGDPYYSMKNYWLRKSKI